MKYVGDDEENIMNKARFGGRNVINGIVVKFHDTGELVQKLTMNTNNDNKCKNGWL